MTNPQKLIIGITLGLVCGVVLKSALPNGGKSTPSVDLTQAPTLAQNNFKPAEATAALPPIGASPTPAADSTTPTGTGGDGKEVIASDGKEVIPTDGKEVIPTDGKEVLPPVGQLLPNPDAVDPGQGGPAIEYTNKTTNQLLEPPTPQNVGGPVVSPETR
jgi:hypothetical protein